MNWGTPCQRSRCCWKRGKCKWINIICFQSVLTIFRKRLYQPENRNDTPEIIIAVMGESGSGKSRFIKQIAGLENVTAGQSLSSG